MNRKATIIGGGVIGGGWIARFVLNGWDVAVFDPDPQAERKVNEVLANAHRSLPSLYDRAMPAEGELTFCDTMQDALAGASWVQENVPERLDLKHKIHAQIRQLAPQGAIIGSSTSGFKPSVLNVEGGNIIVAHPFNPVYLLPLVELVGDTNTCNKAADILLQIGMYPLIVRAEIDAHIADRLLEAVWREGLWLIKDGICTTEELDEAIRMGFGLRWAQMGLFETYRIAGGEAGMKHFMAQFGPALEWPWTKLTDVPEFTDDLVDLIAGQSDAQSGHMSIRELEHLRDDNLVGVMRALKKSSTGAGAVLNAHEALLPQDDSVPEALLHTVYRQVPQSWTDYNGHINEACYVEASAQATDRFLEMIGCNAQYVAGGHSYFTVENHVQFIDELTQGDMPRVKTQFISGQGKKLHLFHVLENEAGTACAHVETLLVHVDLTTRRSSEPQPVILDRLVQIAKKHSHLSKPATLGRAIRSVV